jgi:predicted SAM-dependent methyltransferase
MINTVPFNDKEYLSLQTVGNASQFAIPFAKFFCSGVGVDIGFSKEEWKYPGAVGADIADMSNPFHAYRLPDYPLDYIYTSHCLEHLHDWVLAIEYWYSRLDDEGILFMYLPHPDQEYWKPWNNRKHLHVLYPSDVKKCMERFGFKNVFVSKRDLNYSYMIVGEK